MTAQLYEFLLHWGVMSLSLWVASYIFRGLAFSSKSSLLVSALMLGFANALLRPVLVFLTLPLTLLTFGLFLLAGERFQGIGVLDCLLRQHFHRRLQLLHRTADPRQPSRDHFHRRHA
jgi:hypothetical protein